MVLLASFFLLFLATGLAEQTNRYMLTILRRSSKIQGALGLRPGRADQQNRYMLTILRRSSKRQGALGLRPGRADQQNRYMLTILRRSSKRQGAPGLLGKMTMCKMLYKNRMSASLSSLLREVRMRFLPYY
jgi:hypothetical protein